MRKTAKRVRHTLIPRLLGIQPKVEVYVSLADPHCFMLIQALMRIEHKYRVGFSFYLVTDSLPGTTVAPDLHRRWALEDANLIAELYGFERVSSLPNSSAIISGQQLWQLTDKSINAIFELYRQAWSDGFNAKYHPSTPVINHIIKNQQRLIQKGHYQSGAMFFDGQWFVGVDRLSCLETHLFNAGLSVDNLDCAFTNNELQFVEPEASWQAPEHPIEIYLSLRSPYSYVGFMKALRLSKHYGVELVIKPVLPLMMKGLHVPHNKQKYVYIDAHREASKADIPFSSFTDPIGKGIVNCYHLYGYAKSQNKAKQYIESVFKAIYVDGIDVADEENIGKICEKLEIDYQAAWLYGETDDWQAWADENFAEMEDQGLWGVPCVKYGDSIYWGQDRLPFIEKAILAEITAQ